MKVVDIYLATSQLGKYPPLFTSASVNNYLLKDKLSNFIFQVSKTVVFPKKRKVSEEAKHLILRMLCDEKERIDILGIKSHPWYTGKKMDDWLRENKGNQVLAKDKSHDSGLGTEEGSVSQEMGNRSVTADE